MRTLLAFLIAGCSLAVTAQSVPQYTITQLPPGTSAYLVTHIANNGVLTGISAADGATPGATRAFIDTPATGFISLGTLGGTASEGSSVNEAGIAVGRANVTNDQGSHAFIYKPGIGMLDLAGASSDAVDVNLASYATGFIATPSTFAQAFLYSPLRGIRLIPVTTGVHNFGTSINRSSHVVGYAENVSTDEHAFFYRRNRVIDLPGLRSRATAVNDFDQIAGVALRVEPSAFYGFVADPSGAITELPDFVPVVINNAGQMLGSTGNGVAALYTPGLGIATVESLLPPGSGWTQFDVLHVRSLNDSGQIAGSAINNGALLPFLMSPAPDVVPITIASDTPGVTITVDGNPTPAAKTFFWAPGSTHTLAAPATVGTSAFLDWSDGGAMSHTIATGLRGTTYTARYNPPPAERCTLEIVPINTNGILDAAGGTFDFGVSSVGGNCPWTITTSAPWITLDANTGGVGSNRFSATIAPNPDASARTATLVSDNGTIVHILQAGTNATPSFTDVPAASPYFNFIELLKSYNVTAGCLANPPAFCADAPTTRGQMAAFLTRAIMGTDSFPYVATPYFTDVPASHPFFKHIQKLREIGITYGCTPSLYCPEALVTRDQMAAFVIRARLGESFPIPTIPYFIDVAASNPFFKYVQKMRQLGITNGCTAGTELIPRYCTGTPTTRAQMAIFLIRAFFTEMEP